MNKSDKVFKVSLRNRSKFITVKGNGIDTGLNSGFVSVYTKEEGFLDTVAIFNTNDVISIERVTDDKSLS